MQVMNNNKNKTKISGVKNKRSPPRTIDGTNSIKHGVVHVTYAFSSQWLTTLTCSSLPTDQN